MKDPHDGRPDFEERLREWSQAEPAIDEHQLRRNLLDRIPAPRPRVRLRVVFAAAAASLLAVLIGLETTRQPSTPSIAVEEPAAVYETGDNVILVLREGGEPIYVLTEGSESSGGIR